MKPEVGDLISYSNSYPVGDVIGVIIEHEGGPFFWMRVQHCSEPLIIGRRRFCRLPGPGTDYRVLVKHYTMLMGSDDAAAQSPAAT